MLMLAKAADQTLRVEVYGRSMTFLGEVFNNFYRTSLLR